jgi:AcrR family transcriptional regulator
MPELPKATGRVDRRVQGFRAQVLEVAAELFVERGVEATKVDNLCAAADVAKRTLSNFLRGTRNTGCGRR